VESVNGSVLSVKGFIDGSIGIEDGVVVELSKKKAADPAATGIVLPAFCNAHTHLGDAFIRMKLEGTVEQLFGPPSGLKHRMLAKATEKEVVSGIEGAIKTMVHGGTGSFWDFRETGIDGARMLFKGCLGIGIEPVCMGRPKAMEYSKEEVAALLRICDGLGISSMRDWPYSEVQKLSLDARRAGKAFAIHCSEVNREDIDKALDLKPAFLVHMIYASESDLQRCADSSTPIAICPRSNAFFGKLPNIPMMLSKGVTLMLGTDNAMLNTPSMLREIDFAFRAAKLQGDVSPADIVRMAIRGRKGLSAPDNSGFRIGDRARLAVLDVPAGKDPYSDVLRATDADVALVWLGEERWQRQEKESRREKPRKSESGRPRGSHRNTRRRRR
jgi:cytosine/adenosine deaminase-related metal-dependent hydrolase